MAAVVGIHGSYSWPAEGERGGRLCMVCVCVCVCMNTWVCVHLDTNANLSLSCLDMEAMLCYNSYKKNQ